MPPRTSEKEIERCLENLENPCRIPKHAPKNVRMGNINYSNTGNNRNFSVSFRLTIAMFIVGLVVGFLVSYMFVMIP